MAYAFRRAALAGAIWLAASCSSGKVGGTSGSADGSTPAPTQGGVAIGDAAETLDDGGGATDSGLSLVQVTCPGNATTSLHGTVYDPAGQSPVYNVAVYVPRVSELGNLPAGVSCGSCSGLYTAPLVGTTTDASGNFTVDDMPVGPNIPLVVQIGKWRMRYTLSNVSRCVQNDAAALTGTKLRLPRNHVEGDIPNIAVSTGAADSLECLFSRMGIDAAEYTGDPKGAGRIHIFTGGNPANGPVGATTNAPVSQPSYQSLWNADASMLQYDLVLLSCEGAETAFLTDTARSVLSDYASAGGRVFASHFHYAWFTPTGPFSTFKPALATWQAGSQMVGNATSETNSEIVTAFSNGQSFPGGTAFKAWLQGVGALTDGGLPLYNAHNNVTLDNANTLSKPWITLDPSSPAPNATEYFSFDLPYGLSPSEECGRIVYSGLHVSGGAGVQSVPGVSPDYPSGSVVPDGCASRALTPQEKALEFMVFEMSACTTPAPVSPPPAPI
jgi:hypothetical protein